MRFFIVLLFVLAFAVPAFSMDLGKDQTKLVQHATALGLRAMEFNQGNLPSLLDAEKDFITEGWMEFKVKLNGWLDEKGAATFSSVFVPSGPALDVRRRDRVMYLTIPGVLKHENLTNMAEYRQRDIERRLIFNFQRPH